jgi:hypothetical protein
MDGNPQPAEGAGDGPSAALAATPVETELSATDRLLIALIIVLAVAAVLLLARTTALLLWHDYLVTWDGADASGRPAFITHTLGLGTLLIVTLFAPFDTILHEGAHALGGRLAGFWLEAVQVGVIRLTRTAKGIKLGLAKRRWWVGGSTHSFPTDERNLRLRYALFVALGPLADLLLGFLSAALAHVALTASPPLPTAAEALDIIGLLGLGGFVLNAVPFKLGKAQNDGWFLLQLLTGSRAMERAMLFGVLRGYTLRQIPAEGRSPAVLARAQALAATRAERHLVAVYAYSAALSAGDAEAAGRQLDQAIATAAPPGPAGALAHEIAYFEARYRRRPDAARAWLARASGDQFASFTRPRALAAILLAEGRHAEARTQAAEGLIAREAYAHTSGRQYREEERQLRAMLDEAERTPNTPSAT